MKRSTYLFVVGVLAMTAGAARANEPLPPGWTAVPPSDVTVPAGQLCPFPLHLKDIQSEVITKVVQTNPDGTPLTQVYVGPLYTRFTNTDNNKTVVRNLGGDGLVRYGSDGSQTWTYIGPAATAFFPGGPLEPGLWVVNGFYTILYAADGTQKLIVAEGPRENLCDTLK